MNFYQVMINSNEHSNNNNKSIIMLLMIVFILESFVCFSQCRSNDNGLFWFIALKWAAIFQLFWCSPDRKSIYVRPGHISQPAPSSLKTQKSPFQPPPSATSRSWWSWGSRDASKKPGSFHWSTQRGCSSREAARASPGWAWWWTTTARRRRWRLRIWRR